MKQIRDAMVPGVDVPKSDEFVKFERTFIEKWQAAQTQARKELGKLYALVEMGEEATVDGLISDLVVPRHLLLVEGASSSARVAICACGRLPVSVLG